VAATQQARLVTLLKDGSEGRSIPLTEEDADIGSGEGEVTFPDDPYMSPRHARVSLRTGSYVLRDLDSVNGVYVRLRDEVELRDRDLILLGQQVVRFEVLADGELSLGPAWQRGTMVFGTPEVTRFGRLVQYTTEGVGRDVHYLFRDETVIGRENGDIVFTDDPFLSRRHAAVRVDQAARRFSLHDLGSSNGTALRIRGEHVLRDGDQFRIGRHLFRFEAGPAGGRAGR
jgi:pSer/pThr/pTyr-binding forkhead associated (FHA) protein